RVQGRLRRGADRAAGPLGGVRQARPGAARPPGRGGPRPAGPPPGPARPRAPPRGSPPPPPAPRPPGRRRPPRARPPPAGAIAPPVGGVIITGGAAGLARKVMRYSVWSLTVVTLLPEVRSSGPRRVLMGCSRSTELLVVAVWPTTTSFSSTMS